MNVNFYFKHKILAHFACFQINFDDFERQFYFFHKFEFDDIIKSFAKINVSQGITNWMKIVFNITKNKSKSYQNKQN